MNKKIEVRYLSKTGNTEKLAIAIGDELGVNPKSISEKLTGSVDILFLGGAYYGFMIDPSLKEFINELKDVKRVAIFTTSAIAKGVYKGIKKEINKDIVVLDEHFYCKGEYKFLNKNRPNEEDIIAVKEFARKIVDYIK